MDEADLDQARADARAALRAAVEAADPEDLVAEALEAGDAGPLPGSGGDAGEGVRLAALGKAAPAMARALAAAFPEAPGVCAAPAGVLGGRRGAVPGGWEVVAGGHPLPDEGSLRAGEALLEQAEATPADGRFVVGVSGGGSACAEVPRAPLADLRAVTGDLLAAGVDVAGLNAVRRALSRLKGGGLVRACEGQVVGLVLSDVAGDDLVDVASGPTVPADRAPARARAVLEEAGLWAGAPAPVREELSGVDGEAGEPGSGTTDGDPAAGAGADEAASRGKPGAGPEAEAGSGAAAGRGEGPVNRLVGGNRDAVAGAAEALRERGWTVRVREDPVAGEAREEGRELARRGLEARAAGEAGVAVVAGGEATVTVAGDGRGGPCQELALAAADVVAGEAVVVGAAATDGGDGPTDAAGGLVDGATAGRVEAGGGDLAEALERNDAYRALEAAGGLLPWGPTGTNVNDVVVVLVP